MKKVLLTFVGTLFSLSAMGFDVVLTTENGTANLTCTIIDSAKKTIKIKSTANKTVKGDIVIPETIAYNGEDYTVVEIEASAFASKPQITSITFPSTLKAIPKSVCQYDYGLTSVVLPKDVESIGDYAFRSCNLLETLTYDGNSGSDKVSFPPALTSLGMQAFSNTAFKEVIIPANVTEINTNAFSLCANLEKIHFPDTMTIQAEIAWYDYGYLSNPGYGLCDGCSKLKEANIPTNWAWIPTYMFNRCTSLTSIEIPENIKCIGKGAFQGCTALREFIMTNNEDFNDNLGEPEEDEYGDPFYLLPGPDGANFGMVEFDAFHGCTALERVRLSPSIFYIAEDAFTDCTSLKEVELNEGLSLIGPDSFVNCSSLPSIRLPHTLTDIGDNAFADCSSLISIDIPNSVIEMGGWFGDGGVFSGCSSLESVRLSNELIALEDNMFENCTSLTELCFPPSITTIGSSVINGCENLKNVYMGLNVKTISANALANSGVTDLYITAQTPPSVAASSLPASMQRLHVQREKAQNLYATTNVWKDYTEVDLVIEPDSVVIIQDPGERPGLFRAATTQYNTATRIFATQGDKFSRTAQMHGTDPSIPHLFWKSSDPETAYVDNDGNIHVRGDLQTDSDIKLTAQSLYADMPLPEVTIMHEVMTGVETIPADLPEGADESATHIFTIDGTYAGTSVSGLAPGIYLLKQNKKTIKITVR